MMHKFNGMPAGESFSQRGHHILGASDATASHSACFIVDANLQKELTRM
jgi:hypothetical protein